MNMQHKRKGILIMCFSVLLMSCGGDAGDSGSDANANIDYSYADKEQLQYPTLVRASKTPQDVVYGQGSLNETETYQYYYIYDTKECVVGSVAIDFETANVKDYGLPEDVTVYQEDSRFYLNIWTGPGESRNYIYHSEEKNLQQLAYGDLTLTDEYLYIQGIVLTVDGGAPLHIYTKAGVHVCELTDNSSKYEVIGKSLYYIENKVVEDEDGSYKLYSEVWKAALNGENKRKVCEVIADTIPVIHEDYVTYEDNGSIYSLEFTE